MNTHEKLLEINDLDISFFTPAGEVNAVNGVSFSLEKGKVLGIVGESGSGKSVTAAALMRILAKPGEVLGGDIMFDNVDILAAKEKEMLKIRGAEIAMIFQDPMTSLNPVFTIGNQLIETILQHTDMTKKQARAHARKMLESVGISNPDSRLKQYPHEFSGGMRQRVMIAMALCCQPKLLIADEPTTALDVTIQAQILDLMKKMRNETNAAIILITHDLGIIADICDQVIVMYAGRVVERGSIDDIFYRPTHPYTRGLLKCLPRMDTDKNEKLIPIEGTPIDILDLPKGCSFAPRCSKCMKICIDQAPPLVTIADGHESECWRTALDMNLLDMSE